SWRWPIGCSAGSGCGRNSAIGRGSGAAATTPNNAACSPSGASCSPRWTCHLPQPLPPSWRPWRRPRQTGDDSRGLTPSSSCANDGATFQKKVNKGDDSMPQEPRIAALVADGFQEEECLVPRFALQLLGARVDIVSSAKRPIEIYSYFEKVGMYD